MVVDWRTLALAAALLGAAVACSSTTTGGDDDASEDGNSAGDGDGDGDGDDPSGDGDGDGDDPDTGSGVTVMNDEDDTEPVGDDLTLLFDPMYSAYDGVHDFKLPAIVQGVGGDIRWSANPADAVDLSPDSQTGGILITTRKPGTVEIIARAGRLSGSAMLHITDATPEDWEIGEMRYNNEIPFPMLDIPDGGFRSFDAGMTDVELPDDLSCRNCHSSLATALDVEHTPQQTGGYSDEELISIFTMGMKPADAGFHTPFPESIYTMFHTWEATEAEQKGIVVYLRSLEPKTQGPLDFAGLREQFGGGN